ncbi:MAG: methyltransferase domain-containing protein [Verrucomicrobia bacterium]|nr:methyltransferase domain-containing protein [Verrucomicrobiota bacterium]
MAEASPTDWESKYRAGDTPWEKGEPSPGLVDFLAERTDLALGTVLVPGCGFGHDVRVLARRGFRATGYDLAPSAVRLASAMTPADLPAEFRGGDFLFDEPCAQFDWLFEHTCFCAIDPSLRPEYVQAAVRWLKPGGQLLAVHYLIPDTDGPPFGTTREEVVARFSPHFERVDDWVPRSYPNRTGLERMFWWRKK